MSDRTALDDLLAELANRTGAIEARLNDLNLLEVPVIDATYPPSPHALVGADHTASGLTTGQPLRATSATAFAFGALDLANANAVTGTLPINRGGLGITTAPANGAVPTGNGTGYVSATITGTANRVTVTNGAGSITLSGPQDLHTGASPTFANLTDSGLTSGRVVVAGASGILSNDANLTYNGTALTIASGASGNALVITAGQLLLQGTVGAAGSQLELNRASGQKVSMFFNQTGVASFQLYMPASAAKWSVAGAQDELSVDFTNHRVGINNMLSPAHTLDVNGNINTNAAYLRSGTQVLTARQTGWAAPTATLSRTAVANADTLATTISHLAALVTDLRTHGIIGN